MGYFSQDNEEMDDSLKVIDYIKNVAEYVKTKDGRYRLQPDAGAVSLSFQYAVYIDR